METDYIERVALAFAVAISVYEMERVHVSDYDVDGIVRAILSAAEVGVEIAESEYQRERQPCLD